MILMEKEQLEENQYMVTEDVKVRLIDSGADKSTVAKIINEVCGIEMEKAEAMVNSRYPVISYNLNITKAQELKRMITKAGGRVSLCITNAGFKVTLIRAGDAKTPMLKVLRDDYGINLKEAKHIMDSIPSVISDSVNFDEAREMKRTIEGIGGEVSIQSLDIPDEIAQTSCEVTLKSAGGFDQDVAETLRAFLRIRPNEAEAIVKSAPSVIRKMNYIEARELKRRIEEAGGEVILQS